jgi:hypothetical protein
MKYPGNPAQNLIGQSLPEESQFENDFELAKSWMNTCINSHPDCKSTIIGELPTRYIELSPPGTPPTARLRHSNGAHGSYVALSYCWGAQQPHKTTSSIVGGYTSELPYHNLPQSILDAFEVTRRLGLRNIWIDSLCIIQDDAEDLSREIAKMFSIYQNAQVTISAAKAQNCNEGFLPRSPKWFYIPIRVNDHAVGELLLTTHDSKESLTNNTSYENQQHNNTQTHPINTRAWTLQEELLATRLLIFGHSSLAWKCQAAINSHTDWCRTAGFLEYSLKDIIDSRHPDVHAGPKEIEPMDLSDPQKMKRLMWGEVVMHYMKRELSEEGDRLPAIGAIAEFFAGYLGKKKGEYVAGLWKGTLVVDLLWHNFHEKPSSRLTGLGAPSWSWASTNCPITDSFIGLVGHSDNFHPCVDVLECSTVLVNELAPYGAVVSGELVVHGWLKKVWVGTGKEVYREQDHVSLYDGDRNLFERTTVKRDTSDDLVLESKNNGLGNRDGFIAFIAAWALTLGCKTWTDPFDDTTNKTAYGIVLLDFIESDQERFRRVAYFNSSSLDRGDFWWEQCERVTVRVTSVPA